MPDNKFAVLFDENDVWLVKACIRDINRTAYHGGLGLHESGKYIGILDRIISEYERLHPNQG